MDSLAKGCQRAALFIRKLRGGSQPILVEGTNGLLYVVKLIDNLQGPNIAFNEVAGAELFRACGLAVAQWEQLLVTDKFLDSNHGCWFETEEGSRRPRSGICFASRFLDVQGERLFEILPGSAHCRIRNRSSFWLAWFLDICCDHADNRQAIFREDRTRELQAIFIDSGHLLGGANGDQKPNCWASRYLDPRIYSNLKSRDALLYVQRIRNLDIDGVWALVANMPPDWNSATAVQALSRSLDRLANREMVRAIWEMLLDSHTRRGWTKGDETRTQQGNGRCEVLHASLPANSARRRGSSAGRRCPDTHA